MREQSKQSTYNSKNLTIGNSRKKQQN